jgi:hypothetical protein
MTIVKPWEEWQLTLPDGPHGFSFDLTFTARTTPYEHQTPIYKRAHGAAIWHQIHVQQSCNYNGWIKAGEERIPVEGWWGSRDRSWGVRGPIRGAQDWNGTAGGARKYLWMSAQFDDCAVHTWSTKLPDGEAIHTGGAVVYTDGRSSAPFVKWDEELVVPAGAKIPDAAITTLTDSEGKVVRLTARRATQVYLSGATDTNDTQGFGVYRGEEHVEQDRWTPEQIGERFAAPPRMADNLCRFEWEGRSGSGVYESPVL